MRKELIGIGVIVFLSFIVSIGYGQTREHRHSLFPGKHIVETSYEVIIDQNGKEIMDGPYFANYENAKVKQRTIWKMGKQHGLSTSWYKNGHKMEESMWKENKKDGILTQWDEDGKIKWRGAYLDDKVIIVIETSDGQSEQLTVDTGKQVQEVKNRKLRETKYPDEVSVRPTVFGKTEKLYYVLIDENGKDVMDGLFTAWYKNGWMKLETSCKNGKQEGITTVWYETGEKENDAIYKNGNLEGLSTSWYNNGVKEQEATYKNGKKEGLDTEWSPDGQKTSEGTYKDGKQDGPFASWFQKGQKFFEGFYKDGKYEGLCIWWYEGGQKKDEFTFKNGEFDGPCASWYPTGKKKLEGTFKDGKQNGLVTTWLDDGQMESKATYKYGVVESVIWSIQAQKPEDDRKMAALYISYLDARDKINHMKYELKYETESADINRKTREIEEFSSNALQSSATALSNFQQIYTKKYGDNAIFDLARKYKFADRLKN